MKNIMFALFGLGLVTILSGCATQTSYIHEGSKAAPASGFTEDDIRALTLDVVEKIDGVTSRYAVPGTRRIVNVKKITIDTFDRGMSASYLSETIAQCLKEELTDHGNFIVYNERIAAADTTSTVVPEYVLDATLKQRNVRMDNGDAVQEFSLLIQLTDVRKGSQSYGLEIFNRRFPVRKLVDRRRAIQ